MRAIIISIANPVYLGVTMTYAGKGYGNPRDATKVWTQVKTSAQCQDLCKQKYLQDKLWNGCVYSTTGKWCEGEKNVRGFVASSNYDFWKLGENLFVL